jgi:hypothetical protein
MTIRIALLLHLVTDRTRFNALQETLVEFARGVVSHPLEKEIPRGYWTHLGVWLNFVLAFFALALAVHFVTGAG